jgi:hypothetical protein
MYLFLRAVQKQDKLGLLTRMHSFPCDESTMCMHLWSDMPYKVYAADLPACVTQVLYGAIEEEIVADMFVRHSCGRNRLTRIVSELAA